MASKHLNNSYTTQDQAYYDDYVARVKSAYEFLKSTFELETSKVSERNESTIVGASED